MWELDGGGEEVGWDGEGHALGGIEGVGGNWGEREE